MRHFEKTVKAFDNLALYFQGWEPEGNTQACICLVHGMGEHSGRYQHVAQFFISNQISVLSYDLRGHGKSEGQRGHISSFDDYAQDIDVLLDQNKQRYSNTPIFLYGHSLGGIQVLYYTLLRKPEISGVITTGAGLRTSLEEQKLKLTLAKVLGSLFPTGSLPTGLNPEHLSRDPQVVSNYQNDPLVHDQASFSMAKRTFQAIQWIFEHGREFPLPLLMMHGSDDALTYPRGSEEFAALVPDKCTLRFWDGMYHEIHNEYGKEQVFEFTLDWIRNHLG